MPSGIDRVRLTREQDRRFKLSEAQVAQMRRLYADGATKAELARRFGVSDYCVCYNVDNAFRVRKLAETRVRNALRPKIAPEKRTAYMRELRAYKRRLMRQEI